MQWADCLKPEAQNEKYKIGPLWCPFSEFIVGPTKYSLFQNMVPPNKPTDPSIYYTGPAKSPARHF